jgi:hypothetical protein
MMTDNKVIYFPRVTGQVGFQSYERIMERNIRL